MRYLCVLRMLSALTNLQSIKTLPEANEPEASICTTDN